jgi:hypothetical protein
MLKLQNRLWDQRGNESEGAIPNLSEYEAESRSFLERFLSGEGIPGGVPFYFRLLLYSSRSLARQARATSFIAYKALSILYYYILIILV